MSTTVVRARVESSRAKAAKAILGNLGLRPSDAVNVFFARVVAERGLPFPVQEDCYAYARGEYGLTPREADAAEKRIRQSIEHARRRGTVRKVLAADDLH